MANNFVFRDSLPVAPLEITVLENCENPAAKMNDHVVRFKHNDIEELVRRRGDLYYRGYDVDPYLLHCSCPRPGAGEGRAVINESVKDTDVFVMVDVMNYSIPYTVSGYTNHISPDDHFQDLKRIIGAYSATAYKVSMVTPSPYESRQHKHSKHKSLDCAMALEELAASGVENIITFDAHDPWVQSVIPLIGFDNLMSTYQFIKALLSHDSNIRIDKEHLMAISPDEGVTNHAVYLINNLGVDMGIFYKRRDRPQVIGGRSPIVTHELLGSPVEGKTVPIIDDMISSDGGMLDTCKELKRHKVGKIIICCTFGLFTNGLEKFDEYYHQGYLDYVITINLNYHTQELVNREWYLETDMSEYLIAVIDSMNHDHSISVFLSPAEKTQKLVQERQNGGYEYFQKLI